MLKVLSSILCDLDPKVEVIGQKAGICDGVPCFCCSNRKRVQLNMFSLSSLISQIRKSVVRCCLQYPNSFSPFI